MKLINIGVISILVGFSMILMGIILSAMNGNQKANFGFFGMIGPIPVGFGSSPEMTLIAMAMAVFIMLLYFFIGRRNA